MPNNFVKQLQMLSRQKLVVGAALVTLAGALLATFTVRAMGV